MFNNVQKILKHNKYIIATMLIHTITFLDIVIIKVLMLNHNKYIMPPLCIDKILNQYLCWLMQSHT